jgi:hypothetical protein
MVTLSSRRRSRQQLFLIIPFLLLLQGLDASPFMSVDEVRPGMQGIGRTVYSGTEIEEFGVEVLSILHNYTAPKRDLILVRLHGKIVDEAGVIEGMSGSPVYIDGKLVGALAYRIGLFAKEPIGGVTPIDEMMRIFEPGQGHGAAQPAASDFVPIETPLAVAGMHPQIVSEIKDRFGEYGFLPMSSGSATGSDSEAPLLEPGAMVGFSLVRGDAEMSQIGTLTFVDGDRVLGFGHGAFFTGEVEMPLVDVYVHSVIPSSATSFKLASGSRVIGKLTQDRVVGIGGILGERARLIPVTVAVENGGRQEEYRYEVVQHRLFTPLLVNYVVRNSILSSSKLEGDFSIASTMEIGLDGRRELSLRDVFTGSQTADALGRWVYQPVERLLNSEFGPKDIERINLDLRVEEEVRSARITRVTVSKTLLRPTDTLEVEVELTPMSGGPYLEMFEFLVEEFPRDEPLHLYIGSAQSMVMQEAERSPQRFVPVDFEHLLRLIEDAAPSDELEIQVVGSGEVVQVGGVDLPSLPSSVNYLYRSGRVADRTAFLQGQVLLSMKKKLPHPVRGFERVEIAVEGSRDGARESQGKELK